MTWSTTELSPSSSPRREPPKGRIARHPSPAMMRIGFLAGFLTTGLLLMRGSAYVLGLPADFYETGDWGRREITAFGVSLAGALVGGLAGAAAGLQVSVASAAVNRFLLMLWHFVINGQAVGFVLLSIALAPQRRTATMAETIATFGWTAAGSAAIAVMLFLAGQFRDGRRSSALVCLAVAVPVSLALSSRYAGLFGLSPGARLGVGVGFAVSVCLVSASMIRRDYSQAAQLARTTPR
jgi:hypothetical protein